MHTEVVRQAVEFVISYYQYEPLTRDAVGGIRAGIAMMLGIEDSAVKVIIRSPTEIVVIITPELDHVDIEVVWDASS